MSPLPHFLRKPLLIAIISFIVVGSSMPIMSFSSTCSTNANVPTIFLRGARIIKRVGRSASVNCFIAARKSMPPPSISEQRMQFMLHTHHHFRIQGTTSITSFTSFIQQQRLMFISHPLPLLAMKMSTTSSSSSDVISNSIDSLNDEERAIYHELSILSAKIRKLDESYYTVGIKGEHDTEKIPTIEIQISDDEYDALARREVELCTAYPHLLKLLEEESGLGEKATRFGGRVGQLYDEGEISSINDDEGEKKQTNNTATETTKSKKSKKSTAKKRIKRQHLQNAPMQSLDNAMDDVEAVAWLNRVRRLLLSSKEDEAIADAKEEGSNSTQSIPIQVMAEPKIDGLSLSLRYQLRGAATQTSGEHVYDFVWGATRGDGAQGEDVSEAVQSAWMKNSSSSSDNEQHFSIPKSFTIPTQSSLAPADPPPTLLEVRGEVVLPHKAFEEFTQNITLTANSTAQSFSNARNAASGILLRSKEPTSEEEIERTRFLQSRLQFYAYDIVSSSYSSSTVQSDWMSTIVGTKLEQMRCSLANFGFHVPTPVVIESLALSPEKEVNETDIPHLLDYHHNLMASRDESIGPKSSKATARIRTNSETQQLDFPYQIDGVVYKLSSFDDREICGSSSRTPRWAIAHKFPPQSAVTRLVDIEVQVGRTGALTPVAILEPVDLGGVMVSRASLHNFHFARKILLREENQDATAMPATNAKSVKKGVSVLVSRAGDVIPQIKKRVFDDDLEDEIIPTGSSNETISLDVPQKCPACGSPTSFGSVSQPKKQRKAKRKTKQKEDAENGSEQITTEEEEIDDSESGQVLRCSGPQLLCQPRAVNALAYAYSRAGLDVKGLSKSKLRHLLDEDIIRFPSDLFTTFGGKSMDSSKEEEMLNKIADLPGWGELSSQNLAESVRSVASTGVPLSRYIFSLGIPLVGTQASQLVAETYGNVETFLKALEEASLYDGEINTNEEDDDESNIPPFNALAMVKGIGPTAISALLSFSKEEILMKAAKDLANTLTIHDDSSRKTSDVEGSTRDKSNAESLLLEGMTIVFTGTLPGMSRTVAQNAVKSLGAKATPNTISKATTLVVAGERGGKKARQARELGIRVMDSSEFLKLIEG